MCTQMYTCNKTRNLYMEIHEINKYIFVVTSATLYGMWKHTSVANDNQARGRFFKHFKNVVGKIQNVF